MPLMVFLGELVGKHGNLTTYPIRFKLYPLPSAMRDTVDEEVAQILTLGVIEPSQSPYALLDVSFSY